jgi:hypothetical protein
MENLPLVNIFLILYFGTMARLFTVFHRIAPRLVIFIFFVGFINNDFHLVSSFSTLPSSHVRSTLVPVGTCTGTGTGTARWMTIREYNDVMFLLHKDK